MNSKRPKSAKDDPYAVLGVERAASGQEIRSARKAAAQRLHPDRAGGDAAEMSRINAACALLSDAGRRARYDRDGTTEALPDKAVRARAYIAEIMSKGIEDLADESCLVECLRTVTAENQRGCAQAIATKQKIAEKLRRRRWRIRSRGRDNFLADVLAERIARIEAAIAAAQVDAETFETAALVLADYREEKPIRSYGLGGFP
jgi:curved DNA-binding protein CbpA